MTDKTTIIIAVFTADMDVAETMREANGGTEIDVTVSPRSNRSGIEGIDEWRKRVIVRVKAPPLDGRANKEVQSVFEEITGCDCEIVNGMTSRQKTVLVHAQKDRVIKALRDILG